MKSSSRRQNKPSHRNPEAVSLRQLQWVQFSGQQLVSAGHSASEKTQESGGWIYIHESNTVQPGMASDADPEWPSCKWSLSRCVGGNIVLLIQAFRRKFIIPEFDVFAKKINKIYDAVENSGDGKVSVCPSSPRWVERSGSWVPRWCHDL